MAAHIQRPTFNTWARGFLESHDEVFVRNAAHAAGDRGLVRIRLNQKTHGTLQANYISSRIPEHILPLERHEYVLMGHWTPEMHKKAEYPTLDEINRYYDPGNMSSPLFFQRNSSKTRGRVIITSRELFVVTKSMEKTVERKLSDPDRGVRCALFEDPVDFAKFGALLKNYYLQSIEMEPLPYR